MLVTFATFARQTIAKATVARYGVDILDTVLFFFLASTSSRIILLFPGCDRAIFVAVFHNEGAPFLYGPSSLGNDARNRNK